MAIHRGNTADDYRRAAEAGMSVTEAARALGVRTQSVSVMARKLGLTFRKHKDKGPQNSPVADQ